MKVPFLEYRSALAYNRDVFSVEHGDLLKAFVAIDNNFPALVELPRTRRDRNGKAHVSLLPFMLLLQRQAHAAFDVLSADQSYQAWLLLRPGIEAVLIIGKWIDDPQNARIWQNRDKDPGAYQKTYTGKGLRSTSLPGSEQIQAVLRTINDRFVHANLDYYHRHLNVGAGDPGYVNVLLNYFEDDTLQLVNVFAFLHLLLVMQEGLLALFNRLFGTEASLSSPLAVFRRTYGERIENLARENDECRAVLSELGAWSGGRA
ncbi:MAG: hypothetical protein ACRDFW_13630 [bacterium]